MIRDNRRINIQTDFFDEEEYYAPKHIQDTFESILLNKEKGAIALYNVMDTIRLSKLVNAFNTLRAPLRIRKYSSKVLFMRDVSQHKRSSVSQSGVFKEEPNQEDEVQLDKIKRKYSARYNSKKRSQSVGSVLSKQSNYLRESRKRILQGIHKKLEQKQEQLSKEKSRQKSRQKSKRRLNFQYLHGKQKQIYEQKNSKTQSKETAQINRRIQKLEHLMKNIRRQKQKKQPVIIHQKKTVTQLPKRQKNIQKMRLFIDEIQNLRKQVEEVKQINQTVLRHSKSRSHRSSGSEKSQSNIYSERVHLVNPIKRSQVIQSPNLIQKKQRLNSSLYINKNAEIDLNKRTKSNVKSADKNKRETSYRKQVKIVEYRQDPRSQRRAQQKSYRKEKQYKQNSRERQRLQERQQHLKRKQEDKSRKNSKQKQDLKLKLETIQQKNIFRSNEKQKNKKQAIKQEGRKGSKQISRQASRQASRHISKQGSKQQIKLEQIVQNRKPQSRQRLKRQPSVTQSQQQQLYQSAMNQARKDMRQHKIKIAGNRPWNQQQQFIKRDDQEYIRVQDSVYTHAPSPSMDKVSMKKEQNKVYTNPNINQEVAPRYINQTATAIVNRNQEQAKQKEWYNEYGSPKYNFDTKNANNYQSDYKIVGNSGSAYAYQYGQNPNQYKQMNQANSYREKDSPIPMIANMNLNLNMQKQGNENMSNLKKPNKHRIENLYEANEVADTISRSNVHSNISSPNSNNKPVSPFSYRSYGYNTSGYNKNTFNNAYHSNPVSARDKSAENEEHYEDSYEHIKNYGEGYYNYGTYGGAYDGSGRQDVKNSPNEYAEGYGYGGGANYGGNNNTSSAGEGYTNPELLKQLNIKPFGKSRESSHSGNKYDGNSEYAYVGTLDLNTGTATNNNRSNTNSINPSNNNSNTVSKNSIYSNNYNNLLSIETLEQNNYKHSNGSNNRNNSEQNRYNAKNNSNTNYSNNNNNNYNYNSNSNQLIANSNNINQSSTNNDDDMKLISYNTISDNNSYNSYTYSKGSSKAVTSMNKLEQEYNSIMRGDGPTDHPKPKDRNNYHANAPNDVHPSYQYGDDTTVYETGPYSYAYNYEIIGNAKNNYSEEDIDAKNYHKRNAPVQDEATFSFAAKSNPGGSSRQASRQGSRTSGQAVGDTYAYQYKFKSNNIDAPNKLPTLNLDNIRHQDTSININNAQKYSTAKPTNYAYQQFYQTYAQPN